MADDIYPDRMVGLDSPAVHVVLGDALKSDDTDLAQVTRGVSFVTAGDLKVLTLAGDTVTIPNGALAAGIIHGLRVRRIFSTGTAAAGLVLYS